MIVNRRKLVDLIHNTPAKGVVMPTGGGTGVFGVLLKRGGGSATLISGRIPYDQEETAEILGGMPEKLVSAETTRQLAMAAYQMALKRRKGNEPIFGVASSSSLQKVPDEREGRVHHIYVALQTATKTVVLSYEDTPSKTEQLIDGAENIRQFEEELNEDMILNLVAQGCSLRERVRLDAPVVEVSSNITIPQWEALVNNEIPYIVCIPTGPGYAFVPPWEALVNNEIVCIPTGPGYAFVPPSAEFTVFDPMPSLIFPGSFNPAHAAHHEMADVASKMKKKPCFFELSIRNADKPVLDLLAIQERLASTSGQSVILTNAPLFVDKSRLFPGATFVVGYDTAKRIVDPKYGNLDTMFSVFEEFGTNFIVFGREINGTFQSSLDEFEGRFVRLAQAVTTPLEHANLSSTAIRRQTEAVRSKS